MEEEATEEEMTEESTLAKLDRYIDWMIEQIEIDTSYVGKALTALDIKMMLGFIDPLEYIQARDEIMAKIIEE